MKTLKDKRYDGCATAFVIDHFSNTFEQALEFACKRLNDRDNVIIVFAEENDVTYIATHIIPKVIASCENKNITAENFTIFNGNSKFSHNDYAESVSEIIHNTREQNPDRSITIVIDNLITTISNIGESSNDYMVTLLSEIKKACIETHSSVITCIEGRKDFHIKDKKLSEMKMDPRLTLLFDNIYA